MTENTEDLNEDWFLKRFKAWKTSNHSRDKVVNAIDLIKKMEDVDYDNVIDIVSQLKQSFNEIDIIDNDDDDLGDDFDDPESHKQNISLRKIPTGFSNMDKIMGGGWDHATFNVLMGETNVGKCLDYQTVIKIRNKNTNVIKEIRIGDFFNLIKK
jgi:replicative DNA helicase